MRMGGGFGVSSPDDHVQAERLGWRERCLQAGAMIARRRAVACRRGRRGAISVTARQPDARQRHIVRPFIPAPKRLTSEECRCDQE